MFAGTINGEGSLLVKVNKAAGDSTLARVIKLVKEAEEQKAPTQRFVDKFALIYTPSVFVAAVLVTLLPPLLTADAWSEWANRSLALLVIDCPCALVIATPVSIVSGLTALARCGVLIKGGAYLEAVGKLRVLAVDKTGTITLGRRILRNIQFNVAFAIAIKAIFLIFSFVAHTSLWLAILANTGAALLVIMNALRLLGGGSSQGADLK